MAVSETQASLNIPEDPKVVMPTDQLAFSINPQLPDPTGAQNLRSISYSPFSLKRNPHWPALATETLTETPRLSPAAATTAAPTINLTSPANNATFIAGSTITPRATASDSDGTVSKVEFFQGSVKLGEDTTAPYDYEWTNVAAGDYVLTTRAVDNAGEMTTSTAINISVRAQVKQYAGCGLN